MKGSKKQVAWARSIRKNRLIVWGQSSQFNKYQSVIVGIDDAGWWIANRDKPFEAIYEKFEGDAVAVADLGMWTRTDTPTGVRFASPTRNVVTGEVVVDASVPF
jgi:hypothetical protein